MENGVTLDLFLKDGMLMARAPDGSEHLYADVMRHNNPGSDFDDYTGAPLPVVPGTSFPEGQAPRDNRFGDVAERYGNEELQTAKGLLGGSVNLYDALPESMQGGMMEPINRTIMDAADIGAGLLAGGYGLGQKGAAYLAEILASGTESEKRMARDMLGGFEGSGFGAEGRMLGSIAEAGGRAAAVRGAAERLNQPGTVPVMGSNFGQGWQNFSHWTRSADDFSQFDPEKSTGSTSRLGPHIGTRKAAEDRAAGYGDVPGRFMDLKADTSKPFLNPKTNSPWNEFDIEMFISQVADENKMDRREVPPFMRRALAEQGYTSIPYVNDVEDPGSISHIMLVDRPSGSDAVLRMSDAAFDPKKRTSANLMASLAGLGLIPMLGQEGPQ